MKSQSERQWSDFLSAAKRSGLFCGGSEISRGELFGATGVNLLSDRLVGHMRFDTGSNADGVEALHELLKMHPTVLNGGTVELCEMPKT